jgi:hypothetical protein
LCSSKSELKRPTSAPSRSMASVNERESNDSWTSATLQRGKAGVSGMVRNYLSGAQEMMPTKTSSCCATVIPIEEYRPIAAVLSPATYNIPCRSP